MTYGPKSVAWIGSSRKDLCALPDDARRVMGYAIYLAQYGSRHIAAKPLKGFGGAGVLEVVCDYDGNAFRMVYTVRLEDIIYVLHVFQKKSHRGIETPLHEMEVVKARYKLAMEVCRSLKN